MGDGDGDLTLFNIKDPIHPAPLVNLGLGTSSRSTWLESFVEYEISDLILDEKTLYLISETKFMIFDVSLSTSPELLSSMNFPPKLIDLEIHNGFLNLLQGDNYRHEAILYVIDVSNPRDPKIRSEGLLPQVESGQINLANDLVLNAPADHYLSSGDVSLFDIQDPSSPEFVSQVVGVPAYKAWIAGWQAYIASGQTDFRNPYFPVIASSVVLVDVKEPHDPKALGYIYTPSVAEEVIVRDDLLFIAGLSTPRDQSDRWIWIEAANIEDPTKPELLYTMRLYGIRFEDMDTSEVYTYVAAGEHGLYILRPEVGFRMNTLRSTDFVAPNLFRPEG